MARVTHICLSDLHLGADTAILTDTPEAEKGGEAVSADPLRTALSEALVATISSLNGNTPPPILPSVVLLGDILDFSLGTPKASISSLTSLLEALTASDAQTWLGPFIFVPGNHDHELWTVTRYNAMVGSTSGASDYKHTTPAFPGTSPKPVAAVIDAVLRANGFKGATTFYPNMGLASADGRKMVFLHHGHFVESMYRAMSSLVADLDGDPAISFVVEKLEEYNASWIDFVWSNFGDNGKLGAEVRLGYDYLLAGREDIRFDHRLGRILAKKMQAALPLPQSGASRQWTLTATNALVDVMLGNYGQMERFSYFEPLGADALAGLKDYLRLTVQDQIARERPTAKPDNLTFIFGHTHKPFENRVPVPDAPFLPAVYNTGGWDLDMPMFGTKLGAAAVFIDEDLNVASLRLCKVPRDDLSASAEVHVATADGTVKGNPMAEALQKALDATATEWSAFRAEATKAYRVKQVYIIRQMALADRGTAKTRKALR